MYLKCITGWLEEEFELFSFRSCNSSIAFLNFPWKNGVTFKLVSGLFTVDKVRWLPTLRATATRVWNVRVNLNNLCLRF